ncbi:MAG: hypothetical protein IOD03_16900, partial [Methylocystis sp.]|nr:hypothetical protein [Methylocystis sp.]
MKTDSQHIPSAFPTCLLHHFDDRRQDILQDAALTCLDFSSDGHTGRKRRLPPVGRDVGRDRRKDNRKNQRSNTLGASLWFALGWPGGVSFVLSGLG